MWRRLRLRTLAPRRRERDSSHYALALVTGLLVVGSILLVVEVVR